MVVISSTPFEETNAGVNSELLLEPLVQAKFSRIALERNSNEETKKPKNCRELIGGRKSTKLKKETVATKQNKIKTHKAKEQRKQQRKVK